MAQPELSVEERRLQTRAYNEWARVGKGKPFPTLQDMDKVSIPEFREQSFLLEVGADENAPGFVFVGDNLLFDCEEDGPIAQLDDVPALSLLSRLTDRYLQCLAHRAPVGFEAAFVNRLDHNLLYRGILMPVSQNGETIDHVWGTMNCKDTTDAEAPKRKRAPAKAKGAKASPKPARSKIPVVIEDEEDELLLDEPVVEDTAPVVQSQPVIEPVASVPAAAASAPGGNIETLERPETPAPPAPALVPDPAPATRTDGEKTPTRSDTTMSIDSKLAECMEIDGAMAVALVDSSSGMAIATAGNPRGLNLNVAAAGSTNVLKAKQATLKELGIEEEIEDVLITLSAHYHLIRPLTDESGKGLAVYLILDKAKANLAMARFKLTKIEKDLTV
jgi:hypothetical protein